MARMMRYVSTAGEHETRIDKDLGGCEYCLLKIELTVLYLHETEENGEHLRVGGNLLRTNLERCHWPYFARYEMWF
jgi:hypothetical protein